MFIKGFNKDLKCRGMQFEVGKEYKITNRKKPKLCTDSVFHYCETLQQVHQFYSVLPAENNRFCEIVPLSEEVFDSAKRGAKKIRVIREIIGDELAVLCGLVNGNTGIFNSGGRNSGDRNSGDRNSGDSNSGNWNSGDSNSGNWNSGDRNSGFFNTVTPDNISVFNKPCKRVDWGKAYKPDFLFFDLTKWVDFVAMSEQEKVENPSAETCGGYLRKLDYKEAFQKSYNSLSEEEKIRQTKQLKKLPNFDAAIFFKISGIRIE